jgi:uncharacterized membrane protein
MAFYPIVVYLGLQHLPVSFFGLLLLALVLARWGVMLPSERRILLPLLAGLLVYSILTALSGSQRMLLFYPALINFTLSALFALSLRQEESILLRLVRARNVKISEYGPAYINRLTGLWAVYFAFNGVAAIVSGYLSLEIWALYNGLISYVILAVLIVTELVFRGYYKRRKGV